MGSFIIGHSISRYASTHNNTVPFAHSPCNNQVAVSAETPPLCAELSLWWNRRRRWCRKYCRSLPGCTVLSVAHYRVTTGNHTASCYFTGSTSLSHCYHHQWLMLHSAYSESVQRWQGHNASSLPPTLVTRRSNNVATWNVTHTCLTAFVREYPGKLVPER